MIRRNDSQYEFFLKSMREIASQELVLDLGTFHTFRKELASIQSLFASTRYVAMDYRIRFPLADGSNAPDVDGDLCRLPFRDKVAGGIICKDVLEHVPDPIRAMTEMYRVLRPGGLIYCSLPSLHPYHGSASEKNRDLWRFTRDAIELLFEPYEDVHAVPVGGLVYIARAYAPRVFQRTLFSDGMMPLLNRADRLFRVRSTPMFLVLARKPAA